MGTVMYRYEESQFDETYSRLWLRIFPVIKTTKHGVWIDLGYERKRFVLQGARKCFANPTKEEAALSFLARKRRQVRILEAQLARVRPLLNVDFESAVVY